VEPDDHLLCFDYLYFTSTHERDEFWWEDSPVWNVVGTHLHFSPRVLSLSLLRKALDIHLELSGEESSEGRRGRLGRRRGAPAIHLGSYPTDGLDGLVWDVGREECLAPFVRGVEEVKNEHRQRLSTGKREGGRVRREGGE